VSQKQLDSRVALSSEAQLNTLIYYLQVSHSINGTWLSELETSNELIIHIEDNHTPLLFKGSYRTLSDRSSLILSAKTEAIKKYDFDFNTYNNSNHTIHSVQFEIHTKNHEHFLVTASSIGSQTSNYQLILLKDLKHDDAIKLQLCLFFIILATVCVIFLFLFSLWFSSKAIHPIAESNHKQKEFIAAASHELRSPLSVIQTSAAALLEQKGEGQTRFITFILDECKRMTRLISDLLLLTNADANSNWSLHLTLAEADTLLIEIYDQFYETAAKNSHPLFLDLPNEPVSSCLLDTQRLQQVIIILLDNAFSYTPSGCNITLSLTESSHNICIKVLDNGGGISDEAKKNIFNRFYRVDSSRHKRDHYGLGLSIAYEIIKLHQGKLTLEDTPGGGCTFVITLPIKK
jgi:signal transduction histidine kinase